jgi:hypothetical protein
VASSRTLLKDHVYQKASFELQPEDGFLNKPKHFTNMIF